MKIFTMTLVALTVGWAGCSNDEVENDGKNIPEGKPTTMQFVIHTPKTVKTYAPDQYATMDEMEMKNVRVLVYAYGGTEYLLEQAPVTLYPADFEALNNSTESYKLKEDKKISTTTGNKKILVAMNYNGALPTVGSPLVNIMQQIHTLGAPTELSSVANGFAMFSTLVTDAVLVPEDHTTYPTANKKDIAVKRLVAKISVQEGDDLRNSEGKILSEGGELLDIKFAVGNANKTTYLLQNLVGEFPDIVVQDDNWSSYVPSDFFAVNPATYKVVDDNDATIAAGTIHPVYAPENTTQSHDPDGKNLTYISVIAKYIPGFFVDANGVRKTPDPTIPVSFWTVTRSNGHLYYFDDEHDAVAFKNTFHATTMSDKYVDGICYWRGYINREGKADTNIPGSKAAKFDVLRNTYYKAVISSMKAPGYPTDQGKVIEPTTLDLEVFVQPWAFVEDLWDL